MGNTGITLERTGPRGVHGWFCTLLFPKAMPSVSMPLLTKGGRPVVASRLSHLVMRDGSLRLHVRGRVGDLDRGYVDSFIEATR